MLALGRCHGFTGRPNDPYCYHPGPGILPVWASDLCGVGLVLLVVASVYFFVYAAAGCKIKGCLRLGITCRKVGDHYQWVCGKHAKEYGNG